MSVNGTAAATCVGVAGGRDGFSGLAGERAWQWVEHLDSVAVTDGSVDSGLAATTCVGVSGGGGGVSRRHGCSYMCRCRRRRRWCQSTGRRACLAVGGALGVVGHRRQCVESGLATSTCVGIGGGGGGVSRLAGKRALWSVEHLDSVTVTDGSVESGPAATTCVDVGGGGGGVSRLAGERAWQCVEQMHSVAVTDGNVSRVELAATTCVGVSGGGGGVSRQHGCSHVCRCR